MDSLLVRGIRFAAGGDEARARLSEREPGIRTARDLLRHISVRHIDRARIYRIAGITDAAAHSNARFRARK